MWEEIAALGGKVDRDTRAALARKHSLEGTGRSLNVEQLGPTR
jgi:hypothetical protein